MVYSYPQEYMNSTTATHSTLQRVYMEFLVGPKRLSPLPVIKIEYNGLIHWSVLFKNMQGMQMSWGKSYGDRNQ